MYCSIGSHYRFKCFIVTKQNLFTFSRTMQCFKYSVTKKDYINEQKTAYSKYYSICHQLYTYLQ